MNPKKSVDLPLTKEHMKSEYAKATKAVLSAKTRLINAQEKQRAINHVMDELGYSVSLEDKGEE